MTAIRRLSPIELRLKTVRNAVRAAWRAGCDQAQIEQAVVDEIDSEKQLAKLSD